MSDSSALELRQLVASVQLTDVRLIDAVVRTRVRHPTDVATPVLVTTHGTKVIQRLDDGFIIAASLMAQVVSVGEELSQNSPIFMNITYTLQYGVENAKRFSDDVLQEFARVNGTFNAWPYLREYVQTTSSRMNLPPLMVPVLRVGPPQTDKQPQLERPSSPASVPVTKREKAGRPKRRR
jgi:hypothetical protein